MKKSKKHIAIQLKNISKHYEVHFEKPTLSERFFRRSKKEVFTSLKNISLTIYQGEKVGIVGRNGAGKTTLLKIITGITNANKGKVLTNGRIVSLIDLEAGFHPDLNGKENIFLNGLVIGMTKKEIERKFDQIVEFADIGRFINAPMYTYSSGMKLRLGFSVAIHSDPDILVLDEGIGAGDSSFQIKTQNKVDELFNEGKTILMVSHWIPKLREICTKCLWIESKKIYKFGPPSLFTEYEKKMESRYN
jgi:ABC-type polysaccharide/polyol phosphate transport system ATPase subunit